MAILGMSDFFIADLDLNFQDSDYFKIKLQYVYCEVYRNGSYWSYSLIQTVPESRAGVCPCSKYLNQNHLVNW